MPQSTLDNGEIMHCSNNWKLLQLMWNRVCQHGAGCPGRRCWAQGGTSCSVCPVAAVIVHLDPFSSVPVWWQRFLYASDLKQSRRGDKQGRRRLHFHAALVCVRCAEWLWWSWRRRFCRCRRGTGSETCCSGTGRSTTGRATSTV